MPESVAALPESAFRTFVSHLPHPAFIKDAAGRYAYGNEAWHRLFKARAATPLDQSDEAAYPAEICSTLRQLSAMVESKGEPATAVIAGFSRADENLLWRVILFSLRDAHDRVCIGGLAMDVTVQADFERFAHLQLERLRLATLAARDVIYDWDVATDKVWRSEAAHDLLGSTVAMDDSVDFWVSRIHPDDLDRVQRIFNGALHSTRDRWTADYRLRREDGTYAYVTDRGYIVRDHADRPVRMIGACADVTALHETIEALRESEQRFQLMADTAPVLIWLSDDQGDRAYFNRRWLTFTGRDIADEVGDGWVVGIHPDDITRCCRLYHEAIADGDEFELEYRLRRYDGEYRWILDRGTPRRSGKGELLGYVGSCLDLTERRRAHDRLRALQGELTQAHRLSTLGEMTASLAHELNQPLQAMMSYCGAIMQRLPEHDQPSDPQTIAWTRDTVGHIETQAFRAGQVLDRVQRLLSQKPSVVAVTPVNVVVNEILPLCHAEAQYREVPLAWDPGDDLPSVRGDRVQIQQVVINLVRNALDACDAKRETQSDPDNCEVDVVIATRLGSEGKVRIEIRDRGVGIDAGAAMRPFEPFFSTKSNGMGMGLSICQRIVEAHRGQIWHEENPVGGTVFIVELPAVHVTGTG